MVRRSGRPLLVLGSTQDADAFDPAAAARAGVEMVRRRSGGGAVLLEPGDPLWVDAWLPRGDPLWSDDVVGAAGWVGEWWAAALATAGATGLAVHRGGSVPAPWADVLCFAGIGPGEVTVAGRKVVGVAQWRCRQGALFHTCAYRRWRPELLVGLLAGGGRPEGLAGAADAAGGATGRLGSTAEHLAAVATGTDPLTGSAFGEAHLVAALPGGPAWDVTAGDPAPAD